MKKDNKGTWEISFALPAGRYEYRFWVDEVWHDDPNAQERVKILLEARIASEL